LEHTFDVRKPLHRFSFRGEALRSSTASLFDVIEVDHRQIVWLFEAVSLYAEGDDERLDLFGQLRRELLAHSRAEEEVVYPSLSTAVAGASIAESFDEHRDFDAAVDRLARTPLGEDWAGHLDALRDALLTHMTKERQTLFRLGRQAIPLAAQMELGRLFEGVRNRHLRELGVPC
jgi:hypothetical protein